MMRIHRDLYQLIIGNAKLDIDVLRNMTVVDKLTPILWALSPPVTSNELDHLERACGLSDLLLEGGIGARWRDLRRDLAERGQPPYRAWVQEQFQLAKDVLIAAEQQARTQKEMDDDVRPEYNLSELVPVPPEKVSYRKRKQMATDVQIDAFHQQHKQQCVRRVLRRSLLRLSEDLGAFEQTTHSYIGDRELADVLALFGKAYGDPTAFNISELVQVIEKFCEQESGK